MKLNLRSGNFLEDKLEFAQVKEIINFLSKERSSDHESLALVICTLKNISSDKKEYKDLALAYCKFSDQFNITIFNDIWDNSKSNIMHNTQSLLKWFENDDPQNYSRFQDKYLKKYEDPDVLFEIDIERFSTGIADIYLQENNDVMRIVNTNGDGYIWNPDKLLWEYADAKVCKYSLHTVLEPVFRRKISRLKTEISEIKKLGIKINKTPTEKKDEIVNIEPNTKNQDGDKNRERTTKIIQSMMNKTHNKPPNKTINKTTKTDEVKNETLSISERIVKEERLKRCKFLKKLIQKTLDKVLNGKNIMSIFDNVIVKILDPLFSTKINSNDPDTLPIKNGKIINFKTLEVRKRTKNDLYSFECPVQFLGLNHPCDIARKFFDQLFVGDDELSDFAQQLFGYCLTGWTREKKFWFLWGAEGNNGKTTLIELIGHILGDFYSPVDKEIFLKQERSAGKGAAQPALMILKGKRFCTACETDESQVLDENQVKILTGGDTITARDVYKPQTTFKCISKLMVLTNNPPSYNTVSSAMISRIRLLPFKAVFTETPNSNNKNEFPIIKDFVNYMKLHLDELFTLLAIGAKKWYKQGENIKYPSTCGSELDKTNETKDYLQQFIDECCQIGTNFETKTSTFNNGYLEWCTKMKIKGVTRSTIKANMINKKFKTKKNNSEFYIGIYFQ